MVRYEVIKASTLDELVRKVNEHISRDKAQLSGGIAAATDHTDGKLRYLQALTYQAA